MRPSASTFSGLVVRPITVLSADSRFATCEAATATPLDAAGKAMIDPGRASSFSFQTKHPQTVRYVSQIAPSWSSSITSGAGSVLAASQM